MEAQQFHVKIAALRTDPWFHLDVSRVDISGGNFTIKRNTGGEFNIGPLWNSPSPKNTSHPTAETPRGSKPSFAIRKLLVKKSALHFSDATVRPAFQAALTDLTFEMGALTAQQKQTPVRLAASIEDNATLEIKGWIHPFNGFRQLHLDAAVHNYELSDLNPYATKYIRYEINRGRVTTDVSYRYKAGTLAGNNEVVVHQLQLGKQLGDEFEKRIGVSLKLAIDLLQDANGQIRLEVPVTGDLSDPHFDWEGLVWKAVRHAVIDFVSAPLRLLGNVVTLGGRITRIRIDPVQFQPGRPNPTPKGDRQVEQLANLLKNKPRLEIEVDGFSSKKDVAPLKIRLLAERLKSAGKNYQEAVARLYRLSKNITGSQKLPSLREMENYLAGQLAFPQKKLQKLAEKRVHVVEQALQKLGVDPGRLYAGKQVVLANESSGRVEFDLLTS